jgi:hypothetical protein
MKVKKIIEVLQVNKEIIKKKMKIFIGIFLNTVFILTGFACSNENGNSTLPDSRPGDITFRYHVDGGMMYYSENLFISADSCYYTVNDGGAELRINFTMTTGQLDELYKVFKDNDFDRIETYTEQVYDRGGEGISLNWESGKYCHVNSSGMTFIKRKWSAEFSVCIKAMTSVITSETDKLKKDYQIMLDKSMFDNEIYVQVNRDVVIPKSTLMSESGIDEFIQRTVKLAPGKHRLSVSIGKKYETVNIDTESSKAILLYLENDSLKRKYIH